jgi:hypothetical protein
MWMSLVSSRYHKRRSSVFITGDREVSLVSAATTDVLSSWRRMCRPLNWGRNDSIACRTARSFFYVM